MNNFKCSFIILQLFYSLLLTNISVHDFWMGMFRKPCIWLEILVNWSLKLWSWHFDLLQSPWFYICLLISSFTCVYELFLKADTNLIANLAHLDLISFLDNLLPVGINLVVLLRCLEISVLYLLKIAWSCWFSFVWKLLW